MKIPVYNQEGKEAGDMQLSQEVFGVAMNADLIHQVATSYADNARQVSAHTKNRGEVRGGGRKPWRQKGTGRARHGSTRSPIWVGGGVSGGPRNDKNYTRTIPQQMRKKALCMALSAKAREHFLIVTDGLNNLPAKTKEMAQLIEKLPIKKNSRLVLYANGQKNAYLSGRNIAKTKVEEARNLNLLDALNFKYLMTSREGIKEIEKMLLK